MAAPQPPGGLLPDQILFKQNGPAPNEPLIVTVPQLISHRHHIAAWQNGAIEARSTEAADTKYSIARTLPEGYYRKPAVYISGRDRMAYFQSAQSGSEQWAHRSTVGEDELFIDMTKADCTKLALAQYFAEQSLSKAEAMGKLPLELVISSRGITTATVATFAKSIKSACNSAKSEFGSRRRAYLADLIRSELFDEADVMTKSHRYEWFRKILAWTPIDEADDAANPLKGRKVMLMLLAPFQSAISLVFILGSELEGLTDVTMSHKNAQFNMVLRMLAILLECDWVQYFNPGGLQGTIGFYTKANNEEWFKLPGNKNFKKFKVSADEIAMN